MGTTPEKVVTMYLDEKFKSATVEGELLAKCENLKTLSCASCGLTTLAGFPALANLKDLSLNDNRIADGLEALVGCKALSSLSLANNKLANVDDLKAVAEELTLSVLELEANPLTENEDYHEKVMTMMPTLNVLDGRDEFGNEIEDDDEDDDEDEDARARWSFERRSEDKLEALRERLRKKIESSRTARRAVETAETARDAKEWRERRNEAKREKKRKERANATLTEARRGEKRAKGVDGEAKGGMGAGGGGASDMAFGRITTDDVALNSGRKKKKESKEALLRKVQARQKAIDDAGGEEGGGKAVAEKFAWEAALSRASGEKVLDDPKLLQKSIKREARAKKKSREKWEERTAKVKEQMDAAQTKRKSNIKARKDGKMERKMDKASNKRNRPGFEGRSDGFINK